MNTHSAELVKDYKYNDFEVEFKKHDDGFFVALKSSLLDLKDYHFVYVLFKDRSKAFEIRWTKEFSFEFEDYGDGIYYVQIEYRRVGTSKSKFVRTKTISSLSRNHKDELEKRLCEQPSQDFGLKFLPSKEPFNDFIVVNNASLEIEGFRRFNTIVEGLFIYTNEDIPIFNNFLFSGFCVTDDGNYFAGQNDLCDFNSAKIFEKIQDSVGTFSLVQTLSNGLQFSTDYHASNKLYYFSNKNIILVTNRYHLALNFFMQEGVAGAVFNFNKAIAMLSTGYHQLFSHNFSSESLLCGLFQLYLGEKIIVDHNGLKICKSEASKTIRDEELFDMETEDYESLLEKCATEIKNNVSAVLNSEKFSDVVVDVSGGIDSRTVFCAVSNFTKSKNKVSARILKTQYQNDHLVANTINSLYGYRFHTRRNGWNITFYDPEQYISYIMEAKYFMPMEADIYSPDTILLNGFYGEPSLRPRGAASFLFGTTYEHDVITEESFINNMISFNGSPAMIVDHDKAGYLLKEVYADEFKRTPGNTLSIKLENHYVNFSHAYHASESFRPGRDVASFSPIKSKTLFKLCRSILNVFKSRKLAFDLIYKLNPLVSVVEYENDLYNKEYEETKDSLLVSSDPVFAGANIKPTHQVDEWVQSQKTLSENTKTINVMSPRKEYDTCLALIKKASDKSPDLLNDIKYDLLHYLEKIKDNYIEVNCLKNKLFVIYLHLFESAGSQSGPHGPVSRESSCE